MNAARLHTDDLTFGDAKIILYRQFRVVGAGAVIDTIVENIALNPLNAGDNGPCAMVVRRCTPAGQPRHDENCKCMVRILMQQVDTEPLFPVDIMVITCSPLRLQRQAPSQRMPSVSRYK